MECMYIIVNMKSIHLPFLLLETDIVVRMCDSTGNIAITFRFQRTQLTTAPVMTLVYNTYKYLKNLSSSFYIRFGLLYESRVISLFENVPS